MVSERTRYRLYDFVRKYKRGIVIGPPGVGKSRLMTWCTVREVSSNNNRVFIFSSPLRKLRDYIYYYFRDHGIDPFKLRAHDEVCVKLKERIEKGMDYITALKEHLDYDTCSYYQHFEKLIEYIKDGGQVIVSTHRLGVFGWLFLKKKFRDKKITLIVDEGEDYFVTVSTPVTEDFLKTLKIIDKRIYRKFRSGLKKYRNFYFYQPLFVSKVIFHSFIISATFPKTMMEVLVDEYDYPIYRLHGKKSKDTIIYYRGKLFWEKRSKWMDKFLSIVDQTVLRKRPVGVTVRNIEMGKEVVNYLLNSGWRVSYDCGNLHIDPHADAWILTVGGKFYRGVSFKPLKGVIRRGGEERYDFPVSLGTYQSGEQTYSYEDFPLNFPMIHPLLQSLIDDPWKYHGELRRGINVQSLFRFNRYRDEKHYVIVLDKRLFTSLHHFLENYVNTSRKIECTSLDEVMEVVRKFL